MLDTEARKAQAADYIHQLQATLEQARSEYGSDPEQFYDANIFKMAKFIPVYSELMKYLGVVVSDDVFQELKDIDEDCEDSTLASSLQDLMREWDDFLLSVEPKADSHQETKFILDRTIAESSSHFNNVKSNQQTSLLDLHKSFRHKRSLDDKTKSYVHLIVLRHFA